MKRFLAICLLAVGCYASAQAINVNYKLSLKQPGNDAKCYELKEQPSVPGASLAGILTAGEQLPVTVSQQLTKDGSDQRLTVTITARERVWFNLGAAVATRHRPERLLPARVLVSQEPSLTARGSLVPYV